MAGIPLFLQRIGRGTTSFDEPRSSSANNNNNARSASDKRRSFDMGFVRRRASVSAPASSKPAIEPLSPGKPRRSRLLLASSPKFFAKVAWVDTLSQLATMVPLNQINIPQPVYERVASPEAVAASSAARPTPPLPPRRPVAEEPKQDRSDDEDDDDDDGDTQMFADAESDSPAAKAAKEDGPEAAKKSPSVEASSLAESSLVEPSLAESPHSTADADEASMTAPANTETETETETKQQL
ncbi:hypothetical protein GGI15_002855 [Coemansia interrupta]|uniref:Uncharacterized protein n=1 Tax=Coemansia interrupta TaxID=1126814 RepID=A0A9W8HAG7_9FUNG|nr:hypothetical protein GGI15_002855 [Coemansia interrupta]